MGPISMVSLPADRRLLGADLKYSESGEHCPSQPYDSTPCGYGARVTGGTYYKDVTGRSVEPAAANVLAGPSLTRRSCLLASNRYGAKFAVAKHILRRLKHGFVEPFPTRRPSERSCKHVSQRAIGS